MGESYKELEGVIGLIVSPARVSEEAFEKKYCPLTP